jgi:hypothetical protein
MVEKSDTARDSAQKSGESSERLDNPPLWSPWNFGTRHADWHEVFYDEMRSVNIKTENP